MSETESKLVFTRSPLFNNVQSDLRATPPTVVKGAVQEMALPLCTAETLFDGRWVSAHSPHPYTPAAVGEKLLKSNPAVDGGRYALATHNVTERRVLAYLA